MVNPGAVGQYEVTYRLGIIELGHVPIIAGAQYRITFVASTRGFSETSVSATVVAT